MRKRIRKIMFIVFMNILFCIAVFAFDVNEKVKVEWKGKWYPAKILKVEDGKYLIHYDGYESSWNE